MRFCFRQALGLVLGALGLGVLVFLLLFTGLLTLVPAAAGGIVFFTIASLLSGGGLLALLLGVLRAERSPALADGWLCCGELAGIGAVGALFTSLITSLTVSLEVGLYIGTALVFAFLFLFFGAVLCFLRRYVTVRFSNNCR